MGNFFYSEFFKNMQIQDLATEWSNAMRSDLAEGFLRLLLKLMSLVFKINIKNFRANIEDFSGRYVFRSKDDSIVASASFEHGTMKVYDRVLDQPHVTIIFRNDRALMEYLLSPRPDILGSVLRQDVEVRGNLNYLYKFAFMARRLQLMATGTI